MNDVRLRELRNNELGGIAEIDRRERIDVLVEQRGTRLVERRGHWSAPPWDPVGRGAHSVAAQLRALERYVDDGGVVIGALAGDRLVGIGVMVPHLRPGTAQLAYLHVSAPFRSHGVGSLLAAPRRPRPRRGRL